MKNNIVSRETFLKNAVIFLKDFNLSMDIFDKFYDFYALFLKWNSVHNLSKITNLEDFITLHLKDSLKFLELNLNLKNSTIMDVGSGGGFPGIPLLTILNNNFILVEKRKKKADFLKIATIKEREIKKIEIIENDIFQTNLKADFILLRAVSLKKDFIFNLKRHLNENGKIVIWSNLSEKLEYDFEILSEYKINNKKRFLIYPKI